MSIFLLLDPINLPIAPFLFGGDLGGTVRGFGVNGYVVQVISLAILLVNRELIIRELFPLFQVKTAHPLFKSLLQKTG
ncbi:MAG: hypothetical protein R6U92_03055 [Bacillota bacterium]